MKKAILILLTIVSVIIAAGCSKDDDPSEAPVKERILGKWKFISVVNEITVPSEPPETNTEYGTEGDYFDFRSDGNLYYVLGGDDERTTPYTIENETTLKIESDACTIKELTPQKLVFEFVRVSGNETKKQTYNLSK